MNPSSHHQPPQQRQRRFRRRRVQRSKVKLFWRASWKFIRRNARYIAILLVTIVLSISFSATYLLPHTIPFEGNLVVEELGFTTTQVQPLFDKVQIKELVIRGQQTYIFSGFKG
ncbi:MAG: hypothetical protein ACREPR_24945, partial [Brasilonema sp.]